MPRQTGWNGPSNDEWATEGRLPGDNLMGVPGGPGEHGFSGDYGKAAAADEWPAETVRRGESPAMAADVRRLAESADLPDRAGEYEVPPYLSRPDRATAQAHEPDSAVVMVGYRDHRDAVTVQRFQTDLQARTFVEELLAQGVRQAAIEVYKAYGLPFDVRQNPSVSFRRS